MARHTYEDAKSDGGSAAAPLHPITRDKLRVYVRLRPLLPSEAASGQGVAWAPHGEHGLRCVAPPAPVSSANAVSTTPLTYAFDRVFGQPDSSQVVYANAVSDVVKQAMLGYHGTVFAYGQTVRACLGLAVSHGTHKTAHKCAVADNTSVRHRESGI